MYTLWESLYYAGADGAVCASDFTSLEKNNLTGTKRQSACILKYVQKNDGGSKDLEQLQTIRYRAVDLYR